MSIWQQVKEYEQLEQHGHACTCVWLAGGALSGGTEGKTHPDLSLFSNYLLEIHFSSAKHRRKPIIYITSCRKVRHSEGQSSAASETCQGTSPSSLDADDINQEALGDFQNQPLCSDISIKYLNPVYNVKVK